MNDQDYIIQFYRYFAKFVPMAVLQDSLRQPSQSAIPGYDAVKAEILQPSELVIPDINTYVCSAHPDFVSDRIKNSKAFILFIEYGNISFSPSGEFGVDKKLGINIAHDFNHTNNDNLNEALLMNACNNILNQILEQMEQDQYNNDGCNPIGQVAFPAQLMPIDPESFFGRVGWTAIISAKSTYI